MPEQPPPALAPAAKHENAKLNGLRLTCHAISKLEKEVGGSFRQTSAVRQKNGQAKAGVGLRQKRWFGIGEGWGMQREINILVFLHFSVLYEIGWQGVYETVWEAHECILGRNQLVPALLSCLVKCL